MCTRCRSCRELNVIAVLPTSIIDGTWSSGPWLPTLVTFG
jgi:hypothetical protein